MSASGEAPAPFGGPAETATPGEAGGFFEIGRPRLGGLQNPVRFSDQQTEVINAVVDTLIPPDPKWPTASQLNLVLFFGKYITPSGYQNKHFPFATEDEFKAGLDRLGRSFVDADAAGRGDAITELEKAEDPLFEQLRALTYYGYYSRPMVTEAIQENLPAGRDYHGPPLPYGYLATTEPWDEELLTQAQENGSYIETDDVVRVDLSQLSWAK